MTRSDNSAVFLQDLLSNALLAFVILSVVALLKVGVGTAGDDPTALLSAPSGLAWAIEESDGAGGPFSGIGQSGDGLGGSGDAQKAVELRIVAFAATSSATIQLQGWASPHAVFTQGASGKYQFLHHCPSVHCFSAAANSVNIELAAAEVAYVMADNYLLCRIDQRGCRRLDNLRSRGLPTCSPC